MTIGIIGLGAMGLGIAQVYAQAGHIVHATDADPTARANAKDRLTRSLDMRVAKGAMTAAERDAILNRLHVVDRFEISRPTASKHLETLVRAEPQTPIRPLDHLAMRGADDAPALLLRDVKLLDSAGQLQLNISETRVRLDFWRSLRNWQLTARHFELSGLQYYVDADSLLSSEGATALDSAPVFAALEQLFFQQLTYFSVVDSQLVLQNDDNPDLVVDIKQLDWANRGNRQQR